MDMDTALEKGFLKLTTAECDELLNEINDVENPEDRLGRGLVLLSTFIPEEKVIDLLNLVTIVLDANEELSEMQEAQGHVHGPDCNH